MRLRTIAATFILGACLALVSAAALAGGSHSGPVENNTGITNAHSSDENQNQIQGQAQDQTAEGGNAVAVGGRSDSAALSESGSEAAADASSDNAVNISDSSTSSFEYKIPPFADAGFSNNIISRCDRIIGFDFRGANSDEAGGASFGIPLRNKNCELEAATAQAFALGNYEMGWRLFCSQKAVWQGYRAAHQADFGERPSKNEAIAACIDTGRYVRNPQEEYATKEELDRAFKSAMEK